jgi:hypothetical protein
VNLQSRLLSFLTEWTGTDRGVDWKIFDVGGARSQRTYWAPYFTGGAYSLARGMNAGCLLDNLSGRDYIFSPHLGV